MATLDDTDTFPYTLLRNPRYSETDIFGNSAFGVLAIARSLAACEDDPETVLGLAGALQVIGEQLVTGLQTVDTDDQRKIEAAFAAPDSEAVALAKELRGTEYSLCVNPLNGSYGLLDDYGKWHMWIVGAEDIRKYLASKGVQLSEAA